MDFKLNEKKEYIILNGDFTVTSNQSELDLQNSELVITLNTGNIMDYPLGGVGISRSLNGKLTTNLKRKIESELLTDGILTDSIELDDNNEILVNII